MTNSTQPAMDFWLDLVNTEIVSAGERIDRLASVDDLLRWLRSSEHLERPPRLDHFDSGLLLDEARSLRDSLRRIAEVVAEGGTPSSETIEAINGVLESGPAHLHLARRRGRWQLEEVVTASSLSVVLLPVARSAAYFLAKGDPALLKQCDDPDCIRWFYDHTKNKSRRWCSMKTCGNRAKQRKRRLSVT